MGGVGGEVSGEGSGPGRSAVEECVDLRDDDGHGEGIHVLLLLHLRLPVLEKGLCLLRKRPAGAMWRPWGTRDAQHVWMD